MFEDIIFEQPVVPVAKPRPKEVKSTPPKVKPMTAFEMVKQTDDLRMLTKILDLCKVKVRRQKKKLRKAKRQNP
jgi:hypothetical protein